MAKKITLRDKQKNQLIPVTRATVVEMNDGMSVQEKFDALSNSKKLSFYTNDACQIKIYEIDETLEGDYSEATPVETKSFTANTFVNTDIYDNQHFEIVNPNNSIIAVYAWPNVIDTWQDWFDDVLTWSNVIFHFSDGSNTYVDPSHWHNTNSQGVYGVTEAQYKNCIFWDDNPMGTHALNNSPYYVLHKTVECPIFYSTIPLNTYSRVHEGYNILINPNWSNPLYLNSFENGPGTIRAVNTFAYANQCNIPFAVFADPDVPTNILTLPGTNVQGLCYEAGFETFATIDAKNVTNWLSERTNYMAPFGNCFRLKELRMKNLKASINLSWSPLSYRSLEYLIDNAANTGAITIYVSSRTDYDIDDTLRNAATAKNINITCQPGNYKDDTIWEDVSGIKTSYLSKYDAATSYLSLETAYTSYATKVEITNKIDLVNLEQTVPNLLTELVYGGSDVTLSQNALNEYNNVLQSYLGKGSLFITPTFFGTATSKMTRYDYCVSEYEDCSEYQTVFECIQDDEMTKIIIERRCDDLGSEAPTYNLFTLRTDSYYLRPSSIYEDAYDMPASSGSVYYELSQKQNTLVSGTNIKTINNETLLGSGNINILPIVDIPNNCWSSNDTLKDAAWNEVYDNIKNKKCIYKYAERICLNQTTYEWQDNNVTGKEVTLSMMHPDYSGNYITIIYFSAVLSTETGKWTYNENMKSKSINDFEIPVLNPSIVTQNNETIISSTNSSLGGNITSYGPKKYILVINPQYLTNPVKFNLTVSGQKTYTGNIYILFNNEYVQLNANMLHANSFTDNYVYLPVLWVGDSNSSLTGKWISLLTINDSYSKTETHTLLTSYLTKSEAATSYVSKTELSSAGYLTSHQSLTSYATYANYDSSTHKIYLKHDTSILSEIDCNDFIKDGMVDTAYVNGSYLTISFNGDANKIPVDIPITDIFEADNYYTVSQINSMGYLQSETDPTVPAYVKGITQSDITYWNNKKDNELYDIPTNCPNFVQTIIANDAVDGETFVTISDTALTQLRDLTDTSKDRIFTLTGMDTRKYILVKSWTGSESGDLSGTNNGIITSYDEHIFVTRTIDEHECRGVIIIYENYDYNINDSARIANTTRCSIKFYDEHFITANTLYEGDFSDWNPNDYGYEWYGESPYSTYAFVKRELTSYVSKSELSYASYVTTYSLENIVTYNSYNPVTSYAVHEAITKKPNNIEVISYLPDATSYIAGTTCTLYETTLVNNGDPISFPLMVTGLSNADLDNGQAQYSIDIATWCDPEDSNNTGVLHIRDCSRITEEGNDLTGIHELSCKTFGDDVQMYMGDDCHYPWDTETFNITGDVNFYTVRIKTYINNGSSWVSLNDLTVHQEPDEEIVVNDVVNPPVYDVEYDKHIYCTVEPLACSVFANSLDWEEDIPQVLCIHNAERFLTDEYVPVLMRKSRHKSKQGKRRGWKQYVPREFDGDKLNFRDDGVQIIPTTNEMINMSEGIPYKGVFIQGEPIKYFPHVCNNGTDYATIAHGRNTIDLIKKDDNDNVIARTSYKAHWGISFIKKSDWPRNDRPLNFNKLVTNIAEFKILYCYQDGQHIMRFLS